jgi:hypothetical protein
MPRYSIQTGQLFLVTYIVEADTPEEAWSILVSDEGGAECDDQVPDAILGTFSESSIEELP